MNNLTTINSYKTNLILINNEYLSNEEIEDKLSFLLLEQKKNYKGIIKDEKRLQDLTLEKRVLEQRYKNSLLTEEQLEKNYNEAKKNINDDEYSKKNYLIACSIKLNLDKAAYIIEYNIGPYDSSIEHKNTQVILAYLISVEKTQLYRKKMSEYSDEIKKILDAKDFACDNYIICNKNTDRYNELKILYEEKINNYHYFEIQAQSSICLLSKSLDKLSNNQQCQDIYETSLFLDDSCNYVEVATLLGVA